MPHRLLGRPGGGSASGAKTAPRASCKRAWQSPRCAVRGVRSRTDFARSDSGWPVPWRARRSDTEAYCRRTIATNRTLAGTTGRWSRAGARRRDARRRRTSEFGIRGVRSALRSSTRFRFEGAARLLTSVTFPVRVQYARLLGRLEFESLVGQAHVLSTVEEDESVGVAVGVEDGR